MTSEEKTVMTLLLQKSALFTPQAKQMLQVALDTGVLSDPDFQHLLTTLKMEQNLLAAIDQRANQLKK